MSPLVRLIHLLSADPGDSDSAFDEITELTDALIEDADLALVPELEEHLETFLDRGDFYGRDVIGEVLAGISGPGALPVLLRASARDLDDDQDTFQSIICDLLEQDHARARRAVHALLNAPDPALRATGVWALDFVVSDEDLPALLTALQDPDPRVRSAAAPPLGQLAARPHRALDALTAALRDPDPQVRISVLSSLSHTRHPVVVPHVARLTGDPDPGVREWARIALSQLPGA